MTRKTAFEFLICHFALLITACGQAAAEQPSLQIETSRVLYDFDKPEAAKNWQIVNDGVMGGRSSSKLTISDGGTAIFSGDLSLENNGGFASVRSRPAKLELKAEQEVVLRVRGDGRKYTFNLYVAQGGIAFAYQAEFETKKDQWIEVHLPLAQFVAKSFGRRVEPSNQNVNIREREAGLFAVSRFAGRISEQSIRDHESRLRQWLSAKGLDVAGELEVAGYDPPWMPGPLRRNEVLVRNQPQAAASNSDPIPSQPL